MSEIFVEGSNKKNRELAYNVISFCVKEMLSRYTTLSITLKFSNLLSKDGAEGFCIWEDNPWRPREFTIDVDKNLDYEDMVTCICHEMVHVKQFAKLERRDYSEKGSYRRFWKGKDCENVKYWDAPWEKEAYAMQETLFEKFENLTD